MLKRDAGVSFEMKIKFHNWICTSSREKRIYRHVSTLNENIRPKDSFNKVFHKNIRPAARSGLRLRVWVFMLEVCTELSGSNAIVVNVFCNFGYVQTFGKGTPEKDWRTKLVELQQNLKKNQNALLSKYLCIKMF